MRRPTRNRRLVPTGCIIVATLLAACASSGSDVGSGRSTQHTDESTTSVDFPPPPSVTPEPTTDSTTSAPSAPDTTTPNTPDTTTPETSAPVAGGEDGVGDTLFPHLGNPGIDVQHYDVDVSWDHDTDAIDGTATLTIKATTALAEFTLDDLKLAVTKVTVDDQPATFAAEDPELRITPKTPLAKGAVFIVAVTYSAHGNDGQILAGSTAGWFKTDNGSFVLNEPDGARTWLPSNDHPSDTATYRFTIHVPKGVVAAANGQMVSHDTSSAGETWVWNQPDPMTTYVIQLMTGPLEIVDGTGPNGLPMINVLQAGDKSEMQKFLDDTAKQIDFFDGYFGPFPFTSYGIAMTDGYIGGAMEEAGRSLFSASDFRGAALDSGTALLLSHELTHQWFGDAVSPARWKDIWLNESFATYGQWMWLEHVGYGTVDRFADDALAQRRDQPGATGDPDHDGLFGYNVYEGGAVVLQALRKTVGDDKFFEILRTWVQSNLGTSKTSQDFIALSDKISGKDLTKLFDTWLFSANVPTSYPS